jgi:hypothetical protein
MIIIIIPSILATAFIIGNRLRIIIKGLPSISSPIAIILLIITIMPISFPRGWFDVHAGAHLFDGKV